MRVVDVNFGLNNQEEIVGLRRRGSCARLLDLAEQKLKLMLGSKICTEAEVNFYLSSLSHSAFVLILWSRRN